MRTQLADGQARPKSYRVGASCRAPAFEWAALALSVAVLLAGCVRFEPKPLSPEKSAAEIEAYSLTNAALKEFLAANLHRDFTNWPPATWDLEMLTLAAYYYHPSLEVARADWQIALGGEKTAAERPNPTVTASGIYEPVKDAFSPWIPGLVFDLPIETAGNGGCASIKPAICPKRLGST